MSDELLPPDEPAEPKRAFKGVWIPREIWESTELTWMEKCFLAELDSLDNPNTGCVASNDFLSKRFSISIGRVANILTHLRALKFIETVAFNGRRRSLKVLRYGGGELTDSGRAEFTESVNRPNPPYMYESTGKVSCGESDSILEAKAAEIYAVYPRKVSRPKALKSIITLLKGSKARKPVDPVALLERTTKFAEAWEDATESEKKYCPHPATWFNEERFNDPPSEWRRKDRKGVVHCPNI